MYSPECICAGFVFLLFLLRGGTGAAAVVAHARANAAAAAALATCQQTSRAKGASWTSSIAGVAVGSI